MITLRFSLAIGKKLPPAPGCVDQQLTSLRVMPSVELSDLHNELDIPPAPADTPYALQLLLDMFRAQYLQMVDLMKSPQHKQDVKTQIETEKVIIIRFSFTVSFTVL